MKKVLVTDIAWKDLTLEEAILDAAETSIIAARSGSEKELIEFAPSVDGIMTCWKPVTANVIRSAKRCISIGRFGIGLDNIDVAAATELGIVVTNVPAYCVDEVSDHAMALLLSCARKTAFYDRNIQVGNYSLQDGPPLFRIRGKTLGIVGLGRIGRALWSKARAFGLRIIAHDPYVDPTDAAQAEVETVTFSELVAQSDFISVHVPLSTETHGLFRYETFKQMKPTAVLVNTSRGSIIDSEDLLRALNDGLLAGAGLDVLAEEPPRGDDPLVLHPRTVITPHAAFNSEESVIELRRTAANQMAEILSGRRPPNIVNPNVLALPALRCRSLAAGAA